MTLGVKPVDQLPSAKVEAATWARNLAVNGRSAVIAVTDKLGHDEISALARFEAAARRDRSDEHPLTGHRQCWLDQLSGEGKRRLLSLPQRPTANFAASDGLARVAIEAARSVGISVPASPHRR